jgi:hypothetical protein
MVTNVFSGLPWDMKWEISTFLQRDESANFNEVLRRDERVYKKFEKDFALKHALRILREEHNSIMRRVQIYQDADDFKRLRRAAKRMLLFCLAPRSEIAFMYQRGVKEKLLLFLADWIDEDSEYWEGASAALKDRRLGFARAALSVVAETPFVRHISTV